MTLIYDYHKVAGSTPASSFLDFFLSKLSFSPTSIPMLAWGIQAHRAVIIHYADVSIYSVHIVDIYGEYRRFSDMCGGIGIVIKT